MSSSNDPRRVSTGTVDPNGSHPVGRKKRRGLLLPLLLALLAVLALLALLSQCGGDDDRSGTASGAGAGGTATATTSPSASASPTETASAGADGGAGGAAAAAGTVTSAESVLLSSAEAKPLKPFMSKPAVGKKVKVQSVPADEGFWVGTGEKERLWVQLTGTAGESEYKVKQGDEVDFTGVVTEHGQGFADEVGVTAAEGAASLAEQGAHVSVEKSDVKLSE